WLIKYYAQKKGFEIPEPVPCKPPLVDPPVEDVYWWEIVGCPEGEIEAIMRQVAEAKGMSPDEVRERFGELFPGVDLWSMTFGEFSDFLNSLPQPPLKWEPVCFEELRERPRVIGLFGTVPEFSTHQELAEFNQKLEEVLADVVGPLLRQLCRSERRFGVAFVAVPGGGAIKIGVLRDHPRDAKQDAKEMYQMIAEKAERLFGIENVPVVFIKGMELVLEGYSPSPSSTGWEAPWNEPFAEIPGAVKVTPAGAPARYSTASFAVQRLRWYWPWDPDEDYIITGHKGPGGTITPINMHINQPTPAHEAGRVRDNAGRVAYADAARVGISDAIVIWISAGRTGVTFSVDVLERRTFTNSGPYEELRDQVIVRPRVHLPGTMGGDSGSPYWLPVWDPVRRMHGAKIHGLHVGTIPVNGVDYADGVDLMVLSPVSGVEGEFPGWRVWVRE
ncbi:hypothetical protein M1O47_03170, partial [Dehalococcoidia bacterium]|nr:hypothetical protein [Dehalococcoidia bacterium]